MCVVLPWAAHSEAAGASRCRATDTQPLCCSLAPTPTAAARPQAMQEASKHLAKSRSPESAQLAALQEASDRISRFVQAQGLIVQDPAAAVSLCQQLLQEAPEQVVSWHPQLLGQTHLLLLAGRQADVYT